MSVNKVVVKQTFGLNPNARSCVAFCDDHFLAYASGNQVAIINTETKEQNFLVLASQHLVYKSLGITALACSISKKVIAVAERVDPMAIVSLFDTTTLKKKRVLQNSDLGSREVKSLSFSEDGKYCAIQGGSPEWNLTFWSVDKNPKILASLKISQTDDNPVHQVSICPWDNTVVLVIGKGVFKVFRYGDGQLRPINITIRRDTANILTYCWLSSDHLLLGTEAGEILLIDNFEFRAVVYPVSGTNNEDICAVHSFAPTSRGFVVGCIEGQLRLFERQEDIKEQYQLEESCTLPSTNGNVVVCAVGTDDNLVCATDAQQLFHISVSNLYNMKSDTHHGFDPVLTSFHGPNVRGESSIVALDVGVWRPVLLSCGKDNSVRIWNPSDKKLELVKYFEDDITAISMHPSGLYLAIAFGDKIRIVSILQDDLSLAHEISVRNCSYLKFSNGGHFVAAINGTLIQVFNTFTGALVSTLRGHNNRIRSIRWLNVDASLVSVGAEGVVYFWTLFPQPQRKPSQYVGPVPFYSGTSLLDSSRAFISTNERHVKEISFTRMIDPTTGIEGTIRDPRDVAIGYMCSCVVLEESKKLLLLGTSEDDQPGQVLGFSIHPQLNSNFEITSLHAGPITAMVMSPDGQYLYSGDANGVICVSEFEGSIGKATNKQREGTSSFEFIDEIMIRKAEYEHKKNLISDFTSRVEELTLNNEHQLRLKEMEHQDKVRDITEKFSTQLSAERERYDDLTSDKSNMEKQLMIRIKQLQDAQNKELKDIDTKYKSKITSESNRYKNLMSDIEEIHKRWNEENNSLVESHSMYLKELTEDYEDKLHDEQEVQKGLAEEKEKMVVKYDQHRNYIEEDGDIEINEMKEKYEARLKLEEETGIELMAQHAYMKKNLQMLTKESDTHKDEIKRLRDKVTRLLETIRSLEKDIQSHKKEIREREETITDKEKRIYDLKKKNQELEKFRFVLDYKIKELKLQIAPRENEISTMRKQIEDMGLELDQYHKSNLALNLMINELKLKLDGIRKEYGVQEERYELNLKFTEKIKRDLQELAEVREDPGLLKLKMVDLYRVYVQEDLKGSGGSSGGSSGSGSGATSSDAIDPQEAYNRDREQMERSLDALRRAVKTDSRAHRRDYCKMMRENVVLTQELNSLRKEAQLVALQDRAIQNAGPLGPSLDVSTLLDLLGIETKKPSSPSSSSSSSSNNPTRKGSGKKTQKTKLAEKSGDEDGADAGSEEFPPSSSTSPRPPSSSPSENGKSWRKVPRTTALRTTSADGRSVKTSERPFSKGDHYEAWREIQIQQQQIRNLEDQLQGLCHSLGLNPMQFLAAVDASVSMKLSIP